LLHNVKAQISGAASNPRALQAMAPPCTIAHVGPIADAVIAKRTDGGCDRVARLIIIPINYCHLANAGVLKRSLAARGTKPPIVAL
jgi:hypothetical protein